MALTNVSDEQIIFRSANTGDNDIGDYLEAAELGGRALGDLLADIFDSSGSFIGTGLARWTGAWTTATLYTTGDTFRDTATGDVYVVVTNHTSTSVAADAGLGYIELVIDSGSPSGVDLNGNDLTIDVDSDSKLYASADDIVVLESGAGKFLTLGPLGLNIGDGVNSPGVPLNVQANDTVITGLATVHQQGAGDASIKFQRNAQNWLVGVDGSESDRFVIAANGNIGTPSTDHVVVDTTGNVTISNGGLSASGIDSTPIGATTPAAGTFTTLTGATITDGFITIGGAQIERAGSPIELQFDAGAGSDVRMFGNTANAITFDYDTGNIETNGTLTLGGSLTYPDNNGPAWGNTYIIGNNTTDVISVFSAGAVIATFASAGQIVASRNIYTSNAAGPALLNEAASGTNPTLVPNRADLDTGIGTNAANNLALITGGANRVQIGGDGVVNIKGAGSYTTPILSFNNDFDTGFWHAGADSISVGTGAAGRMTWSNTEIWAGVNLVMSTATGPALLNEAASGTNPTLVPNRADLDTGIGTHFANNLDMIAGGVQVANFDTAGYYARTSGSAATPSIRLNNAGTGFYLFGSSDIGFATGGVARFKIGNSIDGANSNGPGIFNEAASDINPTIGPNKNDPDTGLGRRNNDELVLISGAVNRMTLNANTGSTGGSGSAGAGNQYVELEINGSRYKLLHDGTL